MRSCQSGKRTWPRRLASCRHVWRPACVRLPRVQQSSTAVCESAAGGREWLLTGFPVGRRRPDYIIAVSPTASKTRKVRVALLLVLGCCALFLQRLSVLVGWGWCCLLQCLSVALCLDASSARPGQAALAVADCVLLCKNSHAWLHLSALHDIFGGLLLIQCACRAQAVAAFSMNASCNVNPFELLREDLGASSSAIKIKSMPGNDADKVHPAAKDLSHPVFFYLHARLQSGSLIEQLLLR